MNIVVYLLVGLCLVDFLAGMWFGRCVVPGLKCGACRATDPDPVPAKES